MRANFFGGAILTFLLIGTSACDAEEADVEAVPAEDAVVAPPSEVLAAPAEGAVLTTARTPEYGPYIADQDGRALYLLESDPQGESSCYDACAEVWPPYLAPQDTPTAADPMVQAGLIGTIQRRAGATQVTYGGHPLYYYAEDQGPGRATGQDVHDQWGEWYLVTPQGDPLEEHEGQGS